MSGQTAFDRNVTFSLFDNTKIHPCFERSFEKVPCSDIIYVFLSTLIGLLDIFKPMLGFCLYFLMENRQCAASL